jgi:crossover junction endodeoxyribonuclease RuvC
MLLQTHRPTLLACEELYAHYKHPRTAILMGHARGVILAAAARRGLQVVSIAATHVKKMLTGSGHAAKHQVQFAVAATLGLRQIPEPPDVADAIAIALCGLRLRRTKPVPPDRVPVPALDARGRPAEPIRTRRRRPGRDLPH